MALYLGMDIGGTKCAVVLGDETGAVLDKRKFATAEKDGPWGVLQAMAAAGHELLAGRTVSAVGISCGGPLDSRTGVVLSPPNLPGWDAIPAADFFAKEFGCPAFLQNDANVCALAEWKFGAAQGCENCVFLTFGTGMGAGLVLNGRLYDGTNGMAGEVGHMKLSQTGPVGYGVVGSFEGWCSGGGIARLAKLRLGVDTTAKDLADAARAGDVGAKRVWNEVGRRLGQGLALLADVLNPECIVIGSVYARAHDLLDASMYRALKKHALSHSLSVLRVVPDAQGDSIGDAAALAVAVNGLAQQ